jgi:hypothetical protein
MFVDDRQGADVMLSQQLDPSATPVSGCTRHISHHHIDRLHHGLLGLSVVVQKFLAEG